MSGAALLLSHLHLLLQGLPIHIPAGGTGSGTASSELAFWKSTGLRVQTLALTVSCVSPVKSPDLSVSLSLILNDFNSAFTEVQEVGGTGLEV